MPENEKELIFLQMNRAKELLGFIPGFIELGDYNITVSFSAKEAYDRYEDAKKFVSDISAFLDTV